jgi:hypothetical protein
MVLFEISCLHLFIMHFKYFSMFPWCAFLVFFNGFLLYALDILWCLFVMCSYCFLITLAMHFLCFFNTSLCVLSVIWHLLIMHCCWHIVHFTLSCTLDVPIVFQWFFAMCSSCFSVHLWCTFWFFLLIKYLFNPMVLFFTSLTCIFGFFFFYRLVFPFFGYKCGRIVFVTFSSTTNIILFILKSMF